MSLNIRRLAAAIVTSLAMAGAAGAQNTTSGSIAGTAKDASGAVLPGVTVEAASPALIEKVRTVVTDGQGEYKITNLRPGTYSVTFSLTGFSSVKREGIELNAGFTAPVNAELKVGSLEETVTVTGASPVVDVQNTRSQTVLTREKLDTLPNGKFMANYAAIILGATMSSSSGQDVAGNKGESTLSAFTVHGSSSNDSRYSLEGMIAYTALETSGGPGIRHAYPNPAFMQETVVTTGSASPEIETGGPNVNYIPKDGGNRRTYYGNTDFTNGGLQANNLPADLKARGLIAQAKIKTIYDLYAGSGGPLKSDKAWYYVAARRSVAKENLAGAFFNATHGTTVYTRDLSRPAFNYALESDVSGRVTWQISTKQKLSTNNSYHNDCICYLGVSAVTPPDAGSGVYYRPIFVNQVIWTYAPSTRLLFEAGGLSSYDGFPTLPPEGSGVDQLNDIPMQEKATGVTYNAKQATASLSDYSGPLGSSQNMWSQKFSVSYVTGSHAFKVGTLIQEGHRVAHTVHPVAVRFEFLNGRPSSLTQSASPFFNTQWLRPNMGIYAQDQWTRNRFTFNVGVRFDYLHEMVPETTVPAGPFVTARTYPAVQDVPVWKNWNPRLGVAYDVFKDGRTAVKASISRFDAQEATGMAALNSPANQIVGFVSRTWAYTGTVIPSTLKGAGSTNGVINVPGCDVSNPAANGDCGPISNSKFGTAVPTVTVDPAIKTGNRGFSWQGSVSLQQEVRSGLAFNVGYFRTWYGNYYVNNNLAVAATDFDPFCVTAPTDARLGSVSGKSICGLFDVKPAKFGQVNSYITPANQFGSASQVYSGVDLGMNWRFGQGGLLQGGMNVGRTVLDTCFQQKLPNMAVQSQNFSATSPPLQAGNTPRSNDYCHVEPPWTAGMQFKFAGVYPLPWALQTSATFQNLPGITQAANFTATNALIAPNLGRNLASCGAAAVCNATVSIPIVIPNTLLFEKRLTQLDWRLTKILKRGATRVQANLDLYNVFNSATILGVNTAFGPSFLTPTSVLAARVWKFGAQIDF